MFIISLYHIDLYLMSHKLQRYTYGQSQINLKDSERLALETGFRQGDSHCFRMRCRVILLKSSGISSKQAGLQTEMPHVFVNF